MREITAVKNKPCEATIKMLEEMLEDAKKGEIQSTQSWSISKPVANKRVQVILGELVKLQTMLALNDDDLLTSLQDLRDSGL